MLKEKEINKVKYMYVTARQFKNAIEWKELVPTPKNNFRNKIYPYIVNKSFACEIYLKLLLLIKEERENKTHNLKKLSKDTNMDIEFKKYLINNKLTLTDEEFEEYLSSISNAFEEWRYIYEKKDIKIMHGFLNSYCNYLDEYCKKIMKDLYNIDVDKELIYI